MLVRSLVRLLVPLSLVAGVPMAVVADTAQPGISYVSSYNGPASAYHITRSGKSIDVAPLAILQSGDRVSVVSASDKLGTKMTITLAIDGMLHAVDASRPYCVGESDGICGSHAVQGAGPSAAATVLKNIFASVAPLFATAQEDYYSSKVDQMTSRGPPPAPSMPLLHTTPRAGASLNSGALTIPWLGGKAPFHVRLYLGAADKPVAEKQDVATNEARFDSGLTPGTYRVEIEDGSGAKATGTFDIVADSAIPQLSDDEREGLKHLPASLSVPLSAGMLAKKGAHHEWNLAAYQQLATVPATYPNVQPLRYLLIEAAQ
jgi:hypothetical protein